jgi:predicted PurR-regulated permease PerM
VSSRERWTTTAIRVWALIGILLLVAAGLWLLGIVSAALVPFGIGLLIVLLLRRPVEVLSKHMNRKIAVLLCYLVAFAAIAVALTFLIPPIYAQIAQFIGAVPRYTQQAFAEWDALFVHPAQGSSVPPWLQTAVVALKDQIVAGAGSWSSAIASTAVSAGSSIASGLVGLLLAFIIGFYTLTDLPQLEKEIYLLAGERSRDELTHAFRTLTRVLGGWLRGTLIQTVVIAVLVWIALAVLGVPYALALGVLAGLLNVVPYLGQGLAALLAGGAGLFVSPLIAVVAIAIVLVVQQIDGLAVAPRLMGDQLDLHPLLIILSFLVGATLFGIPGMILSVPIAAVIKGIFVYWVEKRTERPVFLEDGLLFGTAKDDTAATDESHMDADPAQIRTDVLDPSAESHR